MYIELEIESLFNSNRLHFLKLEASDIRIGFPPMRMIGFSTNIFFATSKGTQTNAELPAEKNISTGAGGPDQSAEKRKSERQATKCYADLSVKLAASPSNYKMISQVLNPP